MSECVQFTHTDIINYNDLTVMHILFPFILIRNLCNHVTVAFLCFTFFKIDNTFQC